MSQRAKTQKNTNLKLGIGFKRGGNLTHPGHLSALFPMQACMHTSIDAQAYICAYVTHQYNEDTQASIIHGRAAANSLCARISHYSRLRMLLTMPTNNLCSACSITSISTFVCGDHSLHRLILRLLIGLPRTRWCPIRAANQRIFRSSQLVSADA